MALTGLPLRLAAVGALLAGTLGYVTVDSDEREITAHFPQFKGIYVGDDVTVRGVPVGQVTEVTPKDDEVTVKFVVDEDVHVPADANAVVVAQSVVAVRSIALGPVAPGGGELADGADIPISRTAIPVEWDDIKDQVVDLTEALGPNGANRNGAANDLVASSAEFMRGRGESLGRTLHDVSEAMSTLNDNSGDLFATVRNLQVFVRAIRGSDAQVRGFNKNLATVAEALNGDRKSLVAALGALERAFKDVDAFVRDNADLATSTLATLRKTTSLLAADRQEIADVLHVAPTALSNLYNLLDPRGEDGPIATGSLAIANLQAPATIICGALLSVGGDRTSCMDTIGPIANYFAMNAPPVGIGGLESNAAGPGGVVEPGSTDRPGATPRSTGDADLLGQLLGGQ